MWMNRNMVRFSSGTRYNPERRCHKNPQNLPLKSKHLTKSEKPSNQTTQLCGSLAKSILGLTLNLLILVVFSFRTFTKVIEQFPGKDTQSSQNYGITMQNKLEKEKTFQLAPR